ncbi:CBS domain-containing protein [Modicisalibacter xianhensis]|uniref:CBS domain-containing protein n=2 Tax=Modicisalibacter xianhensis TaxID=442341 RepID=A0A4R8FVQ8_9GAMM|nr:CBS domain-containing protein [Halomonas xianhensis]
MMVDIDLSQAPFSLLDEAGKSRVTNGVDMAYFDTGEVILDAGQSGEYMYIIHKGEVAELDTTLSDARARIGHYTAGDVFGAISILNGKSRYRFKTEQETLCYLLPKAIFEQLCDAYPTFGDFFRESLANKTRLLVERRASDGVSMAGFMLARVAECMRAPCLANEATTVAEAVAMLNDQHADSLLVQAVGQVGIVTKTDLLNALILQGHERGSLVLGIAHFTLVTARPDDYLFQALVSMTRHDVARVVVMEDGQAIGVVELTDVLSYFSSRSYVVSLEVEQADDLVALARASARLPELVRALMSQGVKLNFAMDLLAALNGRIISKAFQFLIPSQQQSQGCFVVMGSEGRGEQILKTDQDNALILQDGVDWPTCGDDMQRLTETLFMLGYPPCPGNIMVSNPEWVNSESGWRRTISRWASRRDGDSLMNLAIMLDAHAVAGNGQLLDGIRQHLFDSCSHDEIFLSYFAKIALRFATPLTLFGTLKRPAHGIDIKKGGIFPIVHGVRTLALECRTAPTSTLARLDALAAQGRLEKEFAADLGEALSLFAELRLKQQLARLDGTGKADSDPNLVVVQSLSSLERDLLREALHIVKDFQQRLSHRFHLEY